MGCVVRRYPGQRDPAIAQTSSEGLMNILDLRVSIGLIGLLSVIPVWGQQVAEYLGDESVLYAQTKQMNQFFRRFNGEERLNGVRIYPGEQGFQADSARYTFLSVLFDAQNPLIPDTVQRAFASEVVSQHQFLDFHGGQWFAEVKTTFRFNGRTEAVTLFMVLEEAEIGSKWVFSNVYTQIFDPLFDPDNRPSPNPPFIHPLSHELDFMNLIKVFRNEGNLEPYARKDYQPDYLTLFLYEIKRNRLTFQSINEVSFHFFQIPGWYFRVSELMRAGTNRGWLITQITRVPEAQKGILMDYIYHP